MAMAYSEVVGIIDRGSTGSGGSTDPPLSRVWGQVMLFDPHFFMHKSMAGSLFTEARSVTVVVFMRENAQTSAFSIRMVIRQNR